MVASPAATAPGWKATPTDHTALHPVVLMHTSPGCSYVSLVCQLVLYQRDMIAVRIKNCHGLDELVSCLRISSPFFTGYHQPYPQLSRTLKYMFPNSTV
jgi:hypothetical protein